MKKHLLLLAFVLAGAFSALIAQTTDNLLKIAGLEPDLSGQTTYYLKNVGTGLYMSYGGEHGAHCIETQQAHPIIVEDNGDGTVAIGSIGGYLESNTLWMDWAKETSKWTLMKVDGYTNQYYLFGDGDRVLTSVGNSAGLLSLNALGNKAVQRWIFTNGADIKSNKMPNASKEVPFDVTVSIRGGAFDLVDVWEPAPNTPEIFKPSMPYGQKWINVLTSENTEGGVGYASNRYDTGIGHGEWDANLYNYCALIWGEGGAVERDVTYSMTLPKGTYHYSFEGFYVGMKHVKTVEQANYIFGWSDVSTTEVDTYDAEIPVTVSFEGDGLSGVETSLDSYGGQTMWDNDKAAAVEFRDNDDHKKTGSFYLSKETTVSVVLRKETVATKEETVSTGRITRNKITTSLTNSKIYLDEFALLYLGEDKVDEADVDPYATYKNYISANVEEYKAALNEEGKAAFDEAFTTDINSVDSRSDYYDAIADMENANNEAIVAHLKAEALKDANATGDFSKAIVNHSFEMGDLTGWELPKGSSVQTGVRMNAELTTEGADGVYLFNSWWNGMLLTQTIAGLPNGVYRMSVLVASGDAGNDGTVYLIANDQKLGVNPPSGGKTFGDYSLKFEVTNGIATFGVVGGNDDDTPKNPVGSYNEVGHWWYKCDNFRLDYLGDDHLVLNEGDLTIRNLDETCKKVTVKRNIKANTWSTFVVPFDMTIPTGWEVKKLTGTEYNAATDNITLIFGKATTIEAGEPYMVRVPKNVTEIVVQDAYVNTTLNNFTADHVTFVGSYVACNIPANSYFISSNKFYLSVNPANPDKIRGFRGYFTPNIPEARSISFRFDDEEGDGTTEIAPSTLIPQPSTEIYDLMGRRVENPTQGIYIVNGKKVIIK